MTTLRRTGGFPLLLLFLIVAASACRTYPVNLNTRLPFPNEAAAGDRVQLVVSKEFRAMTVITSKGMAKWSIPIGQAVADNTKNLLSRMYRSVVTVQPGEASGEGLAIEPRFYELDEKIPGTIFGTYRATIRLGFVVSRSGQPDSREITVTGNGDEQMGGILIIGFVRADNPPEKLIGIATDAALRDALEKLATELPRPGAPDPSK